MAGFRGRPRRFGGVSAGVLAVMALFAAPGLADQGPSAHDLARGRQKVRDGAAEVGRINAALAQADGRLEELSSDAESAVERFNGARVRLERAEQEHLAAMRKSERARHRVDETRHDLGMFAARAYKTDDSFPSLAAVLGGRGGPSGFLDRAVFMQVLANKHDAMVRQEKAASTVANLFERQAGQSMQGQRDATRAAAQARQAAGAAVDRQRAGLKQIQQRKAGLVTALKRARVRFAGLQRKHAAAIAPPRAAAAPPRAPSGAAVRQMSRGLARGSGLGGTAAAAALRWIGTPYSWGGGNPGGPTLGIMQGAHTVGFDCSGLVTYAWARAGVRLVHYATTQYNSGPHPTRDQLRPGDLLFFAHNPSNPGTIHHVGIYIGHDQMVEAPFTGARVRISYAFRPDYAGATRPAG